MRPIYKTLKPNVPYRVRQSLGPWITWLARTLGQPEYRLRKTEYVATVKAPLDEFIETLQDQDHEPTGNEQSVHGSTSTE